jgi:hypothetical protein
MKHLALSMTRARAMALAWASVLPASAALAASTYRIDDTGTVSSPAVTPMRWRRLAPGRAADNTVEGQVAVAARLNLGAWVHRQARIYLALAPTEGDQVRVSWRTQGRLLSGQMRAGSRTVVFEGVVSEPFLQETLLFQLTADGRRLERAQALQFHFEIEVNP